MTAIHKIPHPKDHSVHHNSHNTLDIHARRYKLVVHSRDSAFADHVKQGMQEDYDVHVHKTPTETILALLDRTPCLLMIDMDTCGDHLQDLRAIYRDTPTGASVILAGQRASARQLMALIEKKVGFRMIFKPVSLGQMQITVQAAEIHCRELLSFNGVPATPPIIEKTSAEQPSIEQPRYPRSVNSQSPSQRLSKYSKAVDAKENTSATVNHQPPQSFSSPLLTPASNNDKTQQTKISKLFFMASGAILMMLGAFCFATESETIVSQVTHFSSLLPNYLSTIKSSFPFS